MPTPMTLLASALLLAESAAAAAPPIADVAILDRQGAAEPAAISSIEIAQGGRGGEVRIIEPRGAERARPLADFLAIVPRWWGDGAGFDSAAGGASSAGWLELTDGQRLPGRPGVVSEAGEQVVWMSDRFGELRIELDRVRRMVMRPTGSARSGAPAVDTLWLVNGDRLEGFVESVDPAAGAAESGLAIVIESGGSRTVVPSAQIAEARLANPVSAAAGPVAWLTDGTVVRVNSLMTDVPRSMFRLGAAAAGDRPGVLLAPGDLLALAPDPRRFMPLGTVPVAAHRPIGLMRRPGPVAMLRDDQPAALGAADVLIPGPMVVEWALPEGVVRLVGAARLDEPDWAWGECTVVAELVPDGAPTGEPGREVARARLGGAVVRAALAFDLAPTRAGERLRIRVEPGELGPIRDRVRLERVLLIREPGT